MNFRRHAKPQVFGFQIAPMVDILLVLLVFFIMTWNFSLNDKELDVKIPAAAHSKEAPQYMGQVVVNVKTDGTIVFNHQPISGDERLSKLGKLASLFPDQAVIVRGDQNAKYEFIVDVLDICRQANIWNVAFATGSTN